MSKLLSHSSLQIKLRGLKVLRRLHPDQPESLLFHQKIKNGLKFN